MIAKLPPKSLCSQKRPSPGPGPTDELDPSDPGDETARNFRYQHSYGVVLLAAARRGERPYVSLLCEQHEDFLAERKDTLFDGYQIKTRQPGRGDWRVSDDEFINSIRRFARLLDSFGSSINELFFVSNVEFGSSSNASRSDAKRLGRSPQAFLGHLRHCNEVFAIAEPFRSSFDDLLKACECDQLHLFETLKRTRVVVGPERRDFDATLAQDHLGCLIECQGFNSAQLGSLRDDLVARVYRASSLHVTGPTRHLNPRDARAAANPVLAGKRLVVDHVFSSAMSRFKSAPGRARRNVRVPSADAGKVDGPRLEEWLQTLRAEAADARLIELLATAKAAHKSGNVAQSYDDCRKLLDALVLGLVPRDVAWRLSASSLLLAINSAAFLPDAPRRISLLLEREGTACAERSLIDPDDIADVIMELASVNQGFQNYHLVDELLELIPASKAPEAKVLPRRLIQKLAKKRVVTPAEVRDELQDAQRDDKSIMRKLLVSTWASLGLGRLSDARDLAEEAVSVTAADASNDAGPKLDTMLRYESGLALWSTLIATNERASIAKRIAIPKGANGLMRLRPFMVDLLGGFGETDYSHLKHLNEGSPLIGNSFGNSRIASATCRFLRVLNLTRVPK